MPSNFGREQLALAMRISGGQVGRTSYDRVLGEPRGDLLFSNTLIQKIVLAVEA